MIEHCVVMARSWTTGGHEHTIPGPLRKDVHEPPVPVVSVTPPATPVKLLATNQALPESPVRACGPLGALNRLSRR
jgi:hypothetical protein